ncbi:aquaporin AQPAe.a-like isoform X2 [Ischnura elegans]|uniref:aquaporin AQPAe.a-like isoform X2 n=1 Tax=Ischnura elegans TaxID=197161 RepID=UPI001ED89C31|nr:aquaporin AQPAe.a-like isoform X2 [Ischnura elegans]
METFSDEANLTESTDSAKPCFDWLKRFCRLGVANNTGGNGGLGSVRDLISSLVAEFVGTAILIGVGCCGAVMGIPGPITGELAMNATEAEICARPMPLPVISSMQPAFIFGFTVMAIIQMFGHVSQAHVNPSVTVCSVVVGMLTWQRAILYIIVQCLGAIFGFGVLKLITPCDLTTVPDLVNPNLGFCTTVPSRALSIFQILLAEGLATSILILTVCGAWDRRNANNIDSIPIKFGLTIVAVGLAFGPYTGPGLNPARSLGPAVWNNIWTMHWVYWVVPLTSSFLTSAFYRAVMWPADSDQSAAAAADAATTDEDGDPLTGVRSADGKADGATTRL